MKQVRLMIPAACALITNVGWTQSVSISANGDSLLNTNPDLEVATDPATAGPTPLTTTLVASGFSNPVFVSSPPKDKTRLFVVEKSSGRIYIIKNGATLPTPFITIGNLAQSSEQGLLGMTFHPDFANNGLFYVNYTESVNGSTMIDRYRASVANPDIADPSSRLNIMTVPQPYANHNGGMLAFGPDGYLYIGLGDGGSAYDPQNFAQNLNSKLGKMLRIDVNQTQAPLNYSIPPGNPFYNNFSVQREIWSWGLRNPWRFSFDRLTGDLYIADVGQENYEEVDFQPAGVSSQNYGWNCYEGTFQLSGACAPAQLTMPIFDYKHSDLPGCAIIGGYTYRGFEIPDLRGSYFFADWCKSRIITFRYVNGVITDYQNRTSELAPADQSLSINSISSFGEDAAGELYLIDHLGGEIFKIIPAVPVPQMGIMEYGTGTPGCAGMQDVTAIGQPIVGNPDFKIRVGGAPALSLGIFMFTDAALPIPHDTLKIGVQNWLDFYAATEFFMLDATSNAVGGATLQLPIPLSPSAVGKTFTTQSYWYWPLGNCQTPAGNFSSSVAMDITILP